MIADRPYMRRRDYRIDWSVTLILIVINVAVFILQIASGPVWEQRILDYGALSLAGVKEWYLWQFITFQFLHGGFWHLAFNLLTLYMFGRPLEETLGKVSFLIMYLASGVAGGLLQLGLALIWPHLGEGMVGASAGISGVVGAFALLRPDLTFVLYIVPIRARDFLWLIIGVSVLSLLFNWMPGVAHGAHLGGTLFGIAYLRWLRGSDIVGFWERWRPRRRSRPIVKVRFPKASSSSWEPDPAPARRTEEGDFISKEVDPILDKVNAHGFQSLTQVERDILDKAREKLRGNQ